MKIAIVIAIVLLCCLTVNEALQCYSHDVCSTNCPSLTDSVKTCASDETKCYKGVIPGGVSRGCARDRCNVQINSNSIVANSCCEKDFCNSALSSKLTNGKLLMVIGTMIFILK